MLTILRKHILLITAIWAVLFLPSEAFAQGPTLTCSGGSSSGALFDTGQYCAFTGYKHVLSHVVCKFITLVNEILSKVYCGLQNALVPLLGSIFTLYIAVFGLQLAMGMTELTMREAVTRLLKIGFIWVFATNATLGVSMVFGFFVSLSANGVNWVMDGINMATGGSCTATSCSSSAALCDDDISGATGIMIPLTKLDRQICEAVAGPLTQSNTAILGFFLALSAVFPPVFLLAAHWLWMNFWIMVQGVKTFLFGILSLAFLISMSPIFLSLMLFKATYQFFETWVRYMISFSIQIIIVFACIALWIGITLQFVGFFSEMATIINPMQGNIKTGGIDDVINNWGFCEGYSVTNTPNGPKLSAGSCDETLPVTALMQSDGSNNHMKLIYYMVFHLLTLIILSFAFKALINQAPMIAIYLAGPEYVPVLGQGFGTSRSGTFRTYTNESGVTERAKANAEKKMMGGGITDQLRDVIGKNRSSPPDS